MSVAFQFERSAAIALWKGIKWTLLGQDGNEYFEHFLGNAFRSKLRQRSRNMVAVPAHIFNVPVIAHIHEGPWPKR